MKIFIKQGYDFVSNVLQVVVFLYAETDLYYKEGGIEYIYNCAFAVKNTENIPMYNSSIEASINALLDKYQEDKNRAIVKDE